MSGHLKAIVIQDQGGETKTLYRAIDRLREYGGAFCILYGDPGNYILSKYELVILLGDVSVPWIRSSLPGDVNPETPDAFALIASGESPLTIVAAGNGPRGVLYAAYRLADMLKTNDDLRTLRIVRAPLIPERIVLVSATVLGGAEYKPGLFYRTLRELPRYGYNAVILRPGGQAGSPVSRDESPIQVGHNDEIIINRFRVPEWTKLFEDVAGYGLDVYTEVPPLVPAGFDEGELDAFYLGGREPDGFLPAVAAHFEDYLTTVLDTFPAVKGVITSSTEGSEYGRHRRYFIIPEEISLDPVALADLYRANERILRVYFEILQRVCGARGVRAVFCSHIYGITSDGLLALRKVLYDYPGILCLEDDYWNNNLWIYDLPVMNYLPEEARLEAVQHSFGMSQWCTDAEYYGGASLPSAYPDSLVFSAREAVRLGARMLQQRLNLHDRTPYGTLFNMAEIIPFASSRQVWTGAEPVDELWNEWAVRRFGREASSWIVKALKNSGTIIFSGFQVNGCFLMMHSAIRPPWWVMGGQFFQLFGKPGARVVDKKDGEVVFSHEQYLVQMKTVSVPIAEFRSNNAFALQKVYESISYLEDAKSNVSYEDYRMLKDAFDDAVIVLGVLLRLGEAACAANLALDNYDNVPDPGALLRYKLDELAGYREEVVKPRGSDLMNPPLYEALGGIIQAYETLL